MLGLRGISPGPGPRALAPIDIPQPVIRFTAPGRSRFDVEVQVCGEGIFEILLSLRRELDPGESGEQGAGSKEKRQLPGIR